MQAPPASLTGLRGADMGTKGADHHNNNITDMEWDSESDSVSQKEDLYSLEEINECSDDTFGKTVF